MGMFDYIRCHMPLPNADGTTFMYKRSFQSKCLRREMNVYDITEEGELFLHSEMLEDSVHMKTVGKKIYHNGPVQFYAAVDNRDRLTCYEAVFKDGIVQELVRLPRPLTEEQKEEIRQEEMRFNALSSEEQEAEIEENQKKVFEGFVSQLQEAMNRSGFCRSFLELTEKKKIRKHYSDFNLGAFDIASTVLYDKPEHMLETIEGLKKSYKDVPWIVLISGSSWGKLMGYNEMVKHMWPNCSHELIMSGNLATMFDGRILLRTDAFMHPEDKYLPDGKMIWLLPV